MQVDRSKYSYDELTKVFQGLMCSRLADSDILIHVIPRNTIHKNVNGGHTPSGVC
jgi:hypothetical protein